MVRCSPQKSSAWRSLNLRRGKTMTTRRDLLKLCAGASAFAVGRSILGSSATAQGGWKVAGEPAPRLIGFDERVREFMEAQDVSAGQLAVAFKNKLVLNHGYSNGAHPAPQSTNLFRISSSSKIFT